MSFSIPGYISPPAHRTPSAPKSKEERERERDRNFLLICIKRPGYIKLTRAKNVRSITSENTKSHSDL